jgi:hypothetical protein
VESRAAIEPIGDGCAEDRGATKRFTELGSGWFASGRQGSPRKEVTDSITGGYPWGQFGGYTAVGRILNGRRFELYSLIALAGGSLAFSGTAPTPARRTDDQRSQAFQFPVAVALQFASAPVLIQPGRSSARREPKQRFSNESKSKIKLE